jgi:hypothetical protein
MQSLRKELRLPSRYIDCVAGVTINESEGKIPDKDFLSSTINEQGM